MKLTIEITKEEIKTVKQLIDIGYTAVSIALQYKLIQEINKL